MPKIKIICLMRKGSRRFPGKNTALLFNTPLYLWTVNFFAHFDYPFYLLHDYDNLYIPDWVIEIKRNQEFAGDIHKTAQEIKWSNIDADIYILIQATSPFRSYEQIKMAIEDFIKGDYDCGFNACRAKDGLYYNAAGMEVNFSQKLRNYNECKHLILFRETGSFYIFKKKMLDKKHILESNKKIIFEDPYSFDINTEEDLREIECRLKL